MNGLSATLSSPLLDGMLLLARVTLVAMFVSSAIDKFRADPKEVEMIASLHLPAPKFLEFLTGAFECAASAMILLGAGARLAALALLAFVILTTFAFLRYWSFQGPPDARQLMKSTFYANWAVVGGLVYLAVTGPGRWALWPGV